VASINMKMKNGIHCNLELSYASRVEHDRFSETFILIEGKKGSLELGPDFWVKVTTADGTLSERVVSLYYDWADLRYGCAHASIVDINRNFSKAIQGEKEAETTGEDNLKTLELVYKAYQSAELNEVIYIIIEIL